MSLHLRVIPRQQRTTMSCWWASMAMILEYYGERYASPWTFRAEFARPWNLPPSPVPRLHYPSIDRALDADRSLSSRASSLMYSEPYEWYYHGLPKNRNAFERLSRITGFRGFDNRPAWGSWTAHHIETFLRRYGPYMFFGQWNLLPHTIVVIGVIDEDSSVQVITIDPAYGNFNSETLTSFNRRMNSIYEFLQLPRFEPSLSSKTSASS